MRQNLGYSPGEDEEDEEEMEEEEVDQKSDCISASDQSVIKTNQRRKGGMSRTKHYTTHKT